MKDIFRNLEKIIADEVECLGRQDLFRAPLVAVSDTGNPKYEELKTIIGDWHKTPKEFMPSAKTVISYFVPFTKEIATASKDGCRDIWAESYIVLNAGFNQINRAIEKYINSIGYECFLIAATHTFDEKTLKCAWSHRSAAVISGLGQFGLNNMVITDKGSAGRFCSVITSAPIENSTYKTGTHCGYIKNKGCKICLESCPTKAIDEVEFKRFTCYDEVLVNAEKYQGTIGYADVCGICISRCPHSYKE